MGEQGAADLGVTGDVGDCISDGVHALSVLVRNFNGEILFNGQHKLHARESENKNIEAPAINMSQARAHAQVVAGPKFIGFRAIALVLGIHTRRALRRPASCSTTRRAAQVASQATPKVASRAASVSCGALPHQCLGKPEGFSFKVTESQFVF